MFSSIKVSLNSEVSQQQIAEALKREGIAFIQTGSGLCVNAAADQLQKVLSALGSGFAIEKAEATTDLPPDVRAFMDSV